MANNNALSIKRLLRLNGRDLIKQAYIRMLHRLPDPEGESVYMEKLLQGLPAISLLSALRFSPEGKSINEPVKYSCLLRICGRLLGYSGIPGKIARYIYALRSLSGIRGKSSTAIILLQELENQVREKPETHELSAVKSELLALRQSMDQKFDTHELSMQKQLQEKPDAQELNKVKSELLALQQSITQKFDTYNNFVQSVPVTLRYLQKDAANNSERLKMFEEELGGIKQEISDQKNIQEDRSASLKQKFEEELGGIKQEISDQKTIQEDRTASLKQMFEEELGGIKQEISDQKTIQEDRSASLKQKFEEELCGVKQALIPLSSSVLPFSTYTESPPHLKYAEEWVGEKILMKSVGEKEQQFYTYFSKIGGEEGSKRIKKQHYESYFPYLPSGSKYPFLDIGCGSGEFLSFMQGHNIKTMGIDANESEAMRCQERGLMAYHAEAIDFLKKHEGVFSGISLLQVIEHIPQERYIELLSIAKEKLSPNGVLIIETINAQHPLAFNGFFTDPTHIRPVPIDYLNFITQWCGFAKTGILYLLPMPVLPSSLSSPQWDYYDYAIVAYKEG